jgi:hypothetical protein
MDRDRPGEGRAPRLFGDDTSFAARLERWAVEVRIDDAVRRRTDERWLLQQAAEEGTFGGVLADLAERRAHVAVHTRSGGRHFGRIDVVGVDFVGVHGAAGSEALVALAAVSSLRTWPGEPGTLGDRTVSTQLSLAEVLARLAGERERVMVVHEKDHALNGTLQSVGDDVVVLALDGDGGGAHGVAYLPLQAVGELIVGL